MKNLILILLLLSLINCNNDTELNNNTDITTIIQDVISDNNTLNNTDVTITGFLKFEHSDYITNEECEYPCENYICNYETSNEYLVDDTFRCNTNNEYLIYDTIDNYDNAIALEFPDTNGIDLINYNDDCYWVYLNNHPITLSGKIEYKNVNNHKLQLEQKSARLIINEDSIKLLNKILTCSE